MSIEIFNSGLLYDLFEENVFSVNMLSALKSFLV